MEAAGAGVVIDDEIEVEAERVEACVTEPSRFVDDQNRAPDTCCGKNVVSMLGELRPKSTSESSSMIVGTRQSENPPDLSTVRQ